jgi:hypothetical protein
VPAGARCWTCQTTEAEYRSVIDLLRNGVAAFARLFAPRAVIAAENLLLRHQLVVLRRSSPRPRLRRLDRWLIGTLATRASSLFEAVIVVRPATVLRWHRAAWRLWWRWRSGRRVGRPPIDAELRALIRRMWRDNRLWGENRIAGELAKLGWRVSPRTVAKYRPRHLERGRGQRWRTFLQNHASQVWACDFFTVVTVHFQTLYAFVDVRTTASSVAPLESPTRGAGSTPQQYCCPRTTSCLRSVEPRSPSIDRSFRCPWNQRKVEALKIVSLTPSRSARL